MSLYEERSKAEFNSKLSKANIIKIFFEQNRFLPCEYHNGVTRYSCNVLESVIQEYKEILGKPIFSRLNVSFG